MKRIESGLNKLKWVVVVIITLIIAKGIYTSFNELTAGNFTATPQLSSKDILAESKKHKVILIFFKKDEPVSKALHKATGKLPNTPVVSSDIPRWVYVDTDSIEGKSIVQAFKIQKKPAIVPVWQGSSNVTINGKESQELNQNVFQKNAINEEALKQLVEGKWMTGGQK